MPTPTCLFGFLPEVSADSYIIIHTHCYSVPPNHHIQPVAPSPAPLVPNAIPFVFIHTEEFFIIKKKRLGHHIPYTREQIYLLLCLFCTVASIYMYIFVCIYAYGLFFKTGLIGHGDRSGRALVARVGDRGFKSMVESNQ